MKACWSLLFLLAAGSAALAHDEKFSSSRIDVGADGVTWSVDVSVQGLGKVLTLPASPTELSGRQFQALEPEMVTYLRRCLHVTINGIPVPAQPLSSEPLTETFVATGEKYIAHARLNFRFPSASPVQEVLLSGSFFAAQTAQHHAVLVVSWNGARRSFSRYGPFELELTPRRVQPTWWSTAGEFLVWGMHHIFIGYDHIAFLLALLLGARRLGDVVRVATSFTVAHSLTLLLAALDVLRVPSAVTESLIAASIVYVAAENFFIREAKHRWVLTFAFGLVHGLGFSSVLHERLQDLDSIVLPVVSFNVGVELGQLAILLLAFPVLAWLRNGATPEASRRRQWRLVRIGSSPILLLGSFWLVDRILQKGWMPF
ncbi:MAG TPA: HupE/UreJ family protein [Planctomycetota bacterium]|nr:HupE/UreJ family protein [Planctomycetota bacterium]